MALCLRRKCHKTKHLSQTILICQREATGDNQDQRIAKKIIIIIKKGGEKKSLVLNISQQKHHSGAFRVYYTLGCHISIYEWAMASFVHLH